MQTQKSLCYDGMCGLSGFALQKLDKAPFVCNSCPNQDYCSREHAYYHARKADAKSHAVKSELRKTIHLDEGEVKQLNELVSTLIKNGQSLNHIYANHSSKIGIARRTMYNYVDKCILDARNIDLPRKVHYKKAEEKGNRNLSVQVSRRAYL